MPRRRQRLHGRTTDPGPRCAAVQLLGVVQGVAFGMLIMSTAGAIVGYFVAPVVASIVVNLIPALKDSAPWIDLTEAMSPLLDRASTITRTDVAHIAVAGLIWIVLPLVLGAIRLVRREVKSA